MMAALLWRVALDEAAFRQLVAGQIVAATFDNGTARIEIILSDIGWVPMLRAMLDGMHPTDHPKGPPDPPQAREFLPLRRRR
jgi:hypothetical protein